MSELTDEQKQILVESACETLDKIMDIVNNIGVYGNPDDKTSCYISKCSKQDVYHAIVKIKTLVNRVNTIEFED